MNLLFALKGYLIETFLNLLDTTKMLVTKIF